MEAVSNPLRRLVRALGRAALTALRAFVILLIVVIPVPLGAVFQRMLERARRSEAAQVEPGEGAERR